MWNLRIWVRKALNLYSALRFKKFLYLLKGEGLYIGYNKIIIEEIAVLLHSSMASLKY